VQTLDRQREWIDSIEKNPMLIRTVTVRDHEIRYYTPNLLLFDIAEKVTVLEPDFLDWIDGIEPGAVLYDVGASNGPFTTYAAVKGIQVVAFEPEAQNYAVLEMNHFLNREKISRPIISLNLALSDATGLGKMYCRNYVAGQHVKILDQPFRRLERDTFAPEHVQFVVRETLDHVLDQLKLPFPDHLKIDTDGGELEILEGGKKTLQDARLKEVFIEIAHPDTDGKSIVDCLLRENFALKSQQQVEHYENLYNLIFARKP